MGPESWKGKIRLIRAKSCVSILGCGGWHQEKEVIQSFERGNDNTL